MADGTIVAEWEDRACSYLALSFPNPMNEKTNIEFIAFLPDHLAFKLVKDDQPKPMTKKEKQKALLDQANQMYRAQFNL